MANINRYVRSKQEKIKTLNMRIILLVFIALLTETCNEDSSRDTKMSKEDTSQIKNITATKVKDSLRLQEILGVSDENTSALIIQKDTVFLLTPYHWDKSKYEFLKNFFYDSVNKAFYFNSNGRRNNNTSFIKLDSFLNKPQVFLKLLRNPKIPYPGLPEKLKRSPQIKSMLSENVKIQKYNSDYYFINVFSPKEINVYNSLNNEMKSFPLKFLIFHVTDFFLYDIDKDGTPEMFIFHVGMIPRKEIISFSICSLRSDSAKVYYK